MTNDPSMTVTPIPYHHKANETVLNYLLILNFIFNGLPTLLLSRPVSVTGVVLSNGGVGNRPHLLHPLHPAPSTLPQFVTYKLETGWMFTVCVTCDTTTLSTCRETQDALPWVLNRLPHKGADVLGEDRNSRQSIIPLSYPDVISEIGRLY